MLNNIQLSENSLRYEIDQYTVLREYIQLVFLNALYQHKDSKGIIFKGGTALRLVYGSPRFSEDLDFNCNISLTKLNTLLDEVVKIDVSKIVPSIYLKEMDTLHGYSARLYFKTELSSMPLTIKLDFSFREKSLDAGKTTLSTELPIHVYSLINVFSAKEILAEKIRTIFQRSKGRDIYDIWFLLSMKTELDIGMIDKKMGLINKHFNYSEFENILKQFSKIQLEKDLFKFLPTKQRSVVPKLIDIILDNPQVVFLSNGKR